MVKSSLVTRMLAALLAVLLCGAPALLAQTAPTQPPAESDQHSGAQQAEPQWPETNPAPTPGSTLDPAQGPLEPVAPAEAPLPDAPSATQPQASQSTAPPPAPTPPRRAEPTGTAAAEHAPTTGGAASKPAGTAIAPAKQRQVRSFLIKMGLIAGAGVALGTVFALSKGSPSTPPGSTPVAAPQAQR